MATALAGIRARQDIVVLGSTRPKRTAVGAHSRRGTSSSLLTPPLRRRHTGEPGAAARRLALGCPDRPLPHCPADVLQQCSPLEGFVQVTDGPGHAGPVTRRSIVM